MTAKKDEQDNKSIPHADFALPKATDGTNVKLTRNSVLGILRAAKIPLPKPVEKDQKFMEADDLHKEYKKDNQTQG